jgi:hypothetical protein
MLNTININCIPPHQLTLKKGAPIMMMRNSNPDLSLCNGTRLRIVEFKPHVIHALIMTSAHQAEHGTVLGDALLLARAALRGTIARDRQGQVQGSD